MTTYFDAVLDRDTLPRFNGTREETIQWLQEPDNEPAELLVYLGETGAIMSAQAYLNRFAE